MIRKLKKEEIKYVAENYENAMSINFKEIGEQPISKEKYEKILKKNFKNSFMYVIDDNGIKAFLWFIKDGDEINLEEIFSIEKTKGYGKKLMEFVFDFARKKGIKRINADIHSKNEMALRFIKKFGFTERTIELSFDI